MLTKQRFNLKNFLFNKNFNSNKVNHVNRQNVDTYRCEGMTDFAINFTNFLIEMRNCVK
jgi:hypothetical protein